MKTQNWVSQKIRILHKINKKKNILHRNVRLLKSMFISMHSILGWASFCMNYCINAAWHGDNQPVALLGCNEAQIGLIAAFRSSALLGLLSLIFLLTIPHRFSMAIKHSNTMVIEPAFGTFVSVGRYQVLLENEISISITEAWSALKFPGRWLRWLWTSESTVDQHQQMTWQSKSSLTVKTSHWTFNMDSVSLHSSSRLWDLDFQMTHPRVGCNNGVLCIWH